MILKRILMMCLRYFKILSYFFLSFFLFLSLFGCGKAIVLPIDQRKMSVITTTPMIADMVDHIAGHRVIVRSLVEHDFHFKSFEMTDEWEEKILAADVVFSHGLAFDQVLTDQLLVLGVQSSVVTKYMKDHDLIFNLEFPLLYDPYVWQDPLLWVHAIDAVRDQLIALDPKNRRLYLRQAKLYYHKIMSIHDQLSHGFKGIENRILVTSKDSLNYFKRRYDFEVLSVYVMTTVNRQLLDVQADEALWVNQFYVSSANLTLLFQKGGHGDFIPSLYTLGLGNFGSLAGTYLGMMVYNKEVLIDGFKNKN